MEETHNTRASDAATRKRRSSILKSQRAPRTPLSELEFHVATPTDTTKSRRVSFSKRMGVAEFATHEATTTWKNFYEEHNKSLESSGNDSAVNARPSVSHIGKRLFDQQFEEVEAVGFGSALIAGNSKVADFNISINNINLTQQLAALECNIDDRKLSVPQQHFELSSITDHQSKLFGNDLTIPVMGEMSNQINVNFSLMNPIGSNDKCDDLDEIQKDLRRPHNVICPGPFRDGDMSEYIEVDLNMTHIAVRDDGSNMSITDTIRSPNVKEVSKSNVSINQLKKPTVGKDWTADKENIAVINPYIAPRESDNFAINEVPDEVLVFDGKRLTSEKKGILPATSENFIDKENYRQTLLLEEPAKNIPQRKTIVLNVNDDLPNFGDSQNILPTHHSFTDVGVKELKQTMIFDEGNLSITQAVPSKFDVIDRQRTINCENTIGNISLTQAVPANLILEEKTPIETRKTIIYDNNSGNISVTQPVPAIIDNKPYVPSTRRNTVYDDGNISFTQVVPANLIMFENIDKPSNTKMFQDIGDDISLTQALPNNIQLEKYQMNNKTTVFDKSIGNISMTQVLPSNIILSDNKLPVQSNSNKTVYENDDYNISMTEAIPKNLIITEKIQVDENKRKTILFDNNSANISSTQPLPTKIIQEILTKPNLDFKPYSVDPSDKLDVIASKTVADTAMNTCNISTKKRLTIMFDDDADVSVTQALTGNILSSSQFTKLDEKNVVLFEKSTVDISLTQALPSNILLKEVSEVRTTETFLRNQDLSMNKVVTKNNCLETKSMIIDSDQKISTKEKIIFENPVSKNVESRTSQICHMSMTKTVPEKIFETENELLKTNADNLVNLTQYGENTLLQETIQDKSFGDIKFEVYQTTTNNTTTLGLDKTSGVVEELESNKSIGIQSTNTSVNSIKSSKVSKEDIEIQTMVGEKISSIQKELNPVAGNLDREKIAKSQTLKENERKKSIIHELLDMSSSYVEKDIEDKNEMDYIEPEVTDNKAASNEDSEKNSNDDIFIITNDIDGNIQRATSEQGESTILEKIREQKHLDKNIKIENKSLPALDFKKETVEMDNNLDCTLVAINRKVKEKEKSPQNRFYEKIVSSDLQATYKDSDMDISNVNDLTNVNRTRKSLKDADDTKELLEMLADFTDRKSCAPVQEKDDKNNSSINPRRSVVFENKTIIPEPRSFAPKRQSIALSREDMLHSISMAQAALQQSRFEYSDSIESMEDTTIDSPNELNESLGVPKKSVRISDGVVKTLHFDDESCSNTSIKSDIKISPLKKTAFGETSYMNDNRANVIPSYLKDVTDNLKALMNDLVKPRPDQMPFETIVKAKKQPSTCSTQIQANLITSSQIDLDVELRSNAVSLNELNTAESGMSDVEESNNHFMHEPVNSAFTAVARDVSKTVGENKLDSKEHFQPNSPLKKTFKEPLLFFDHNNPLNNILLAPPDCLDVHKYNPNKSSKVICDENDSSSSNIGDEKQYEVERVTTQYRVEGCVSLQSGDACSDKKGDSHSLISDPSKPLSMDRSTDGIAMELKDTEVNTLIVMKGNKELLEASSSLTLVDDALTQSVFDIKVKTHVSPVKDKKSPVKVIYKIDNENADLLENVDSDLVSNDDEPMEYAKAKKRNYSPMRREVTRPSTLSSPDVTPKPVTKMQRISNSPNVYNTTVDLRQSSPKSDNNSDIRQISPEKSDTNSDSIQRESHKKKSPRKSKGSPKHKKPGTDVTVQQLMTEFKITKMDQDIIEEQIMDAIHDKMSSSANVREVTRSDRDRSSDVVSSCTSSKDQREMHEVCVKETVSYVGSQPSRVDWQPELRGSSKVSVTECESGANVVAKIDMLPFMGSRECEWETCGGDTWAFLVLRGRVRLRVRLAHRHHNALRTRVLADTPVREMCVDVVPIEEPDPLAALCVRLAAEAMRYECSRAGGGAGGAGAATAGGVPAALRRCAGVARVALRWARAMRDARARLAYSVNADGDIALKVANVSLRSVWEVSMRVELVVEDAREGAWARAAAVRVAPVLAERAVPPAEVERALAALPHDWGHAPRAIWKIFRYLKNKTREDDFLRL